METGIDMGPRTAAVSARKQNGGRFPGYLWLRVKCKLGVTLRLIFDMRKRISFTEGLFLVGKVKRRKMTSRRKGEQKSNVI